MDKSSRIEQELTSFNFIPEGDEEGLISKIFSKFKSAVTGPQQQQQQLQQQQQSTSPSSSSCIEHEKIPIMINTPSTPSPKSNSSSPMIEEQQQIPSMIPLTKTSSIDSDTQSVMTTFSVSNTNSLSRVLNRLRKSEQIDSNKEFWIPDEQCKECNNCKSPFNLFRRKHHCRTCGRIFCSKCLTNNIHTSHSLRVCNDCYIKYVAGYHADDTISLHDGYSYSSVVVDSTLSSSLIPQPSQQKSILIPTSGDDDSSDEEQIEFERPTNSFDLQRSNLELHFSQSTSSHHTQSDTDLGLKKLLTNTLLRGTPRSRTSTMNSLGIDTSLATLETVRQQSPMPFRRNSLVGNSELHNSNVTTAAPHHTHQHQTDYYDGEDDDLRRWDKNPSNLLNFLGGERPNSGIFDDLDSPTTATPVLSTSTSTINKWFMRSGNPNVRRRLSLTENVSSSNLLLGNTSPNLNSGSSTSSGGRHIRVRTKSLMRNTPITVLADTNDHDQQLTTPSISTPVNRSLTPDLDHAQPTHQQWDASFIYLMRNIIVHLLEESALLRSDWEEVMMKLLLKTADDVQPHLRLRDTFNMNHYVKIKKIPGGRPKDSFSVNGVVFSKSVAHKGMMRQVKHPSILILNFDVDGVAVDGMPRSEYLKFDRLLAWERDHMDALSSEIIGLKPHIVLFASNVPRTMIECLNKAKIVVANNVKKQKLDAIARCTDATVFNYKNELWNAKTISPGKCGVFEPLTILHEYMPNRRKTYLMFHECPKERGNTIVLRGGDLETLEAVKFIMNFMVKVVNNINLEAQLRKDFIELRRWNQSIHDGDGGSLHKEEDTVPDGGRSTAVSLFHAESSTDALHMDTQSVLSVAESQITVNTIDVAAAKKKSQQQFQQTTVIVEDDDICLTAVNAVLKQYQTALLSVSPGVRLPVPHILLKLRDALKKLIGIIREKLGVNITGNTLATDNSEQSKQAIPPIPTDLNYMQDYLKAFDAYLEHDLEYRHYQDLYLQCWLLYKRYIGGVHQYLSPIYHQQMLVRRTTTPAEDHTIPCEKAVLDPYEYYNPLADCTLVQYILKTVKDAYTKCNSKMCGNLLIFHDKTYSHGNAQIKVQVFLEDDNGDEEVVEESVDIGRDEYLRKIPVFMSTFCNICKVQHQWKPMSELLQRYSFGKFLELLFYQSDPIPLFDESDQTRNYFGEDTTTGCPHGFYRDHTISFRIQNLSVNFTHATVQVLEVVPPPLHLRFSSKQQMAIKDASLDSARTKIAKFFDSVIERNKAFSYDIVQPNMVETCKEYLQELSQDALKTKKNMLQKLQMVYATSVPTDTLQLNLVLAELKNHVVEWDLKYVEFARRFVRPERELRRLTTTHLRKMFPAENLYNSATTNAQTVSNLNLRTKRAIEAADLPLLDVELDNDSYGTADMNLQFDETNLHLKEQPLLGESPTESYPWSDELTRFDEMFLQVDKAKEGNENTSKQHQREPSNSKKLSGADIEPNANIQVQNTSQSIANLIEDDSSRDLDPSVARRLSLELMKDAPKKKMEQQQQIENKKQQKKTLKYLQESRMIEKSASNDTLNSTTVSSSRSSLPIPIKQQQQQLEAQSQLGRHAAALPILSSTTYKRLAGLLPDPIVGKSKSSPSPVNYLYNNQQQRNSPYQKLIDQKRANRKSTLLEPSYTMLDDDETSSQQQQQFPIVKPSFYRGSPYTAKTQDHSTIAYRYGFMSGLNTGLPLVERRLGATNITHPVSSAIAAANAAAASTAVINTSSSNNNQDLFRPRSRTMAIVNNGDQAKKASGVYSQKSHLPVPVKHKFRQHGRHFSESKVNNEVKIKEITRDDESSSSDEEDNGTVHLLDDCDEDDDDEMDDSLLPFQYKSFSLFGMDEYDESLGREMVPSILELQEFHREHQLQISKNTLPFLSLECGLIDKKNDHHLSTKSSVATMIGAADLLQSNSNSVIGLEHSNGSSNLDWSTHDNGRNSIMKAITYVLAEKSISNLLPLEYPFSFNEHIFSDSRILVREDEPSSIISYMLGSQFYDEKLQRKQEARMSKAASSGLFNQDTKEKQLEMDPIEGKSFFSEMFPETDEREKPWKFFFQHEATSFSCKIYFAEQFDMLRKSCGCDDIFISSLARCTTYDPAGGKSGSMFLKTKDERFLIKQISKYEMDAFLGSANKYFMYMFNEVFDKGIPTVLCKIFGLYRIGFYNSVSGKSMKMDILVMENLFYDTSVKKVFDLKGSMRNRYAEKTGKDVEVFLDENLVEIISKTPLYMKVDTKCNLSDSLYNDTQFLLSIDVMDYSLLVGFNEDTNEIYVGIVDFIRTFTWDKKLESWVKESGMLGGGRKDPTIVSPKMYRKRFRSAIDLYFCMIPDFWTLILE